MTEASAPLHHRSYWLTRFVLLRLLGFVYAAAFLSAALQLVPLIGSGWGTAIISLSAARS